jgi:hypothetical protein
MHFLTVRISQKTEEHRPGFSQNKNIRISAFICAKYKQIQKMMISS